MTATAHDTSCLVLAIISIAIMISSIGALRRRQWWERGALLWWPYLAMHRPAFGKAPLKKLAQKILDQKPFRFVMLLRLINAFAMTGFAVCGIIYVPLVLLAIGLQLLYTIRKDLYLTGADQLTTLLLFAIGIAGSFNREFYSWVSLNFISTLVSIGYFTAGLCRFSSRWLSGRALTDIMSTRVVGHRGMYTLFVRHRWLSRLVSVVVPVVEIALGAALPLPEPFCVAVLCVGFIFHIAIAFLMGLADFWLVFPAAYPAIWFTCIHGFVFPH